MHTSNLAMHGVQLYYQTLCPWEMVVLQARLFYSRRGGLEQVWQMKLPAAPQPLCPMDMLKVFPTV